nr:HNH endonuclease [Actinomycetota bacterium]
GWDPARGDPLDDHFASAAAQWPWPPIPPAVPGTGVAPSDTAAPGRQAPGRPPPGGPPPGGLLDITLPWATFTGTADACGTLGRIGPITAPEARRLTSLALRNPSTQWRIILTDADRHAIAVARVPRARPATGSHDPPGSTRAAGIVGRVTIVLPADALDTAPASHPRLTDGIYARLLAAARRARDRARQQAEADRHAPGGCAHITASSAYQPPPRIREYVAARDHTCRGPRCGQPAGRADLDHTIPYDQGGPTCPCDLGAVCRRHHRLKQHPGWTVTQPKPGMFCWTTPAGRTYTTYPHQYCTG